MTDADWGRAVKRGFFLHFFLIFKLSNLKNLTCSFFETKKKKLIKQKFLELIENAKKKPKNIFLNF